MGWSLLRDKASPAVVPWGSPKAAQGTCRFGCVLIKSRKAAPPLPSFTYQVHNPHHNFTSICFSPSLGIFASGLELPSQHLNFYQTTTNSTICIHSSL